MKNTIKVGPNRYLSTYWEPKGGNWVAYYVDGDGNQVGDCWYAATRDEILVFRPEAK